MVGINVNILKETFPVSENCKKKKEWKLIIIKKVCLLFEINVNKLLGENEYPNEKRKSSQYNSEN